MLIGDECDIFDIVGISGKGSLQLQPNYCPVDKKTG